MNTSRSSKRDLLPKTSGSIKSPNKRASQGKRKASPSPPPYNLRSGRKPGSEKTKTANSGRRTNSKGKNLKSPNRSRSGSQDKPSPSHLEKHRSSKKKHTITTNEVEETIKDEINHKFGHTTTPGRLSGRSSHETSPRNTSNEKEHKQTKIGQKTPKSSKSSTRKSGSKHKPRNKSTPNKQQQLSREATPSKQKGTGKKTPGRKSSVSKGNKSDRIEEEKTGGKKSIGKRSASRTPGKIEEESNKKGLSTPGKGSVGKGPGGRSPGRMLLESDKKGSKHNPSKAKESKGKSSVGKRSVSKSPGLMLEESTKKTTNTPSKGKSSKRKAAEISKNPDLGVQGDLQSLGGTTTHASMKRVKKNDEILGKEELEQIKIVDLAKKKPSTSSRRQTRASSGKAGKDSAGKESVEKERSPSSEKKSKKKVLNSKKKTEAEEETKTEMVEMRLLGLRVVVKGGNYCIWRKITMIDDIPMTKVARIIVASMGWLGCWDWKFKIGDKEVLLPPDDEDDREETTRQKCYGDQVTLTSFGVKEGDKFQFIYHPGSKNPWVLEILVESLDRVQVDTSESGMNSEKGKMFQHAVVVSGSLAAPSDKLSPIDFEKAIEDFEKGEREFEKWKGDLADDFNLNSFNKNKINETLKIHIYDDSKMDPKIKEGDIFFKW